MDAGEIPKVTQALLDGVKEINDPLTDVNGKEQKGRYRQVSFPETIPFPAWLLVLHLELRPHLSNCVEDHKPCSSCTSSQVGAAAKRAFTREKDKAQPEPTSSEHGKGQTWIS